MHAGYAGCRRISELNLINHTDFELFDVIYGYDKAQVPPDLAKKKIIANTDVIVITKASSDITSILADVVVGAGSIKVEQNPATQGSPYLLISDCKNADLFTAKNWEGKTIHCKDELGHSYQAENSTVRRFEEVVFFIGATKHVTAKNQPIYSLYFSVNRGDKQELVSGISDMQIIYGVDERGQGKGTQYLKATEITERKLWDKVLSVVITLKPQNRLLTLKQWKIYIKLRERGG